MHCIPRICPHQTHPAQQCIPSVCLTIRGLGSLCCTSLDLHLQLLQALGLQALHLRIVQHVIRVEGRQALAGGSLLTRQNMLQ